MSTHRCPVTGKRSFDTYGEALAAYDELVKEGKLRADQGSIYTCVECGLWHISSKRFTLVRARGRGKTRKRLVYKRPKGRGAA
jgi:hypothetical protein